MSQAPGQDHEQQQQHMNGEDGGELNPQAMLHQPVAAGVAAQENGAAVSMSVLQRMFDWQEARQREQDAKQEKKEEEKTRSDRRKQAKEAVESVQNELSNEGARFALAIANLEDSSDRAKLTHFFVLKLVALEKRPDEVESDDCNSSLRRLIASFSSLSLLAKEELFDDIKFRKRKALLHW